MALHLSKVVNAWKHFFSRFQQTCSRLLKHLTRIHKPPTFQRHNWIQIAEATNQFFGTLQWENTFCDTLKFEYKLENMKIENNLKNLYGRWQRLFILKTFIWRKYQNHNHFELDPTQTTMLHSFMKNVNLFISGKKYCLIRRIRKHAPM